MPSFPHLRRSTKKKHIYDDLTSLTKRTLSQIEEQGKQGNDSVAEQPATKAARE